jgi:hypothetical protein
MGKVLVKSSADYADEFDVHGFVVMSEEDFADLDKKAKDFFDKSTEELECYFGTNEAVTYDCYDDWKHDLTVTPITDKEADTLKKLFGRGFGRTFIYSPAEQGM